MRLHYNWMVLVAIFWTILLDASARETIANAPSVRGFEKRKSVEEYEEKSNEHSRRNDSAIDDDRSEVQDNATVSSRDDAKQRIEMIVNTIDNAGTIEADNRHSQESTQIDGIISASQNNIETKNEYSKRAGKPRYTNYDEGPFQLVVHGTVGRVSTTENVTVSRVASDGLSPVKPYIFPKVQDAVGVNFDINTVRSNETTHRELAHRDLASKLARASETSARLISNSSASSMNYRTADSSLGTRSDESEPMTKYSDGETQPMVSSSKNIDSAGGRRSMDKAMRSSSSNRSSTNDRLSSPNRRTSPSGSSLANIAFRKYGYHNKRKNKLLPLNIRSPMGESLSLWESKDTSSVASQGAEWTVVDETVTTPLSYPEEEKSVSNKIKKTIALFEKEIVEEPPDKDQALVSGFAHSETARFSTDREYLSQREAYRVTIPSRNEHESSEFVTTGSTNNINLLPIVNDIPRALFEEGSVRNSEPSDTGTYNAEMGISTGSEEKNFQHTNILKENRMKSPSRLSGMKMVDGQRQEIREINYRESTESKAVSYLGSLPSTELSEIKGGKVTAARRNKVAENEVSGRGRSGGTKTNEEVGTPHPSTGTKRVSGDGEFVDNAANPDSTRDNRIHRSVVKIALTGFQTERRSHKSLIGRDSAGGINLPRDQTQNHVQGQREQVLKSFPEIDSPEIGRFRVLEDEASESITLENSNTFSSSDLVQWETDALESNVAPKRTKKMQFSRIDPDDNRAARQKSTGRDRAIPSRGPTEVSQASLRVGAEDRGIGVVKKTLANMIGKIDWHVGSDTPPSIASPFPELRPEDHGPVEGEHDCKGDGVTTERQRHDESFIQNCREDRSGTNLPGSRSKSYDRVLERQLTVSNRFASISPKDKPTINHIAGVTRPFAIVDETDREDKRVPMKYEFFGRANYKRKLKIDEGNSDTEVNTLKVRDSTVVVEDPSKIGVESRNHNDGKMVDVKLCETCTIVGVAENASVGHEGSADDAGSERRIDENVDHDTKKNESKIGSMIRSKITRTNEIPVDAVLTVGHGASLTPVSAEFKVIDHSRREARVAEQLQQEDAGLLVRGQEPIFVAPKRENSILSRARLTALSLGSGELKAHDDAVSSGLSLDQPNENNENGPYSHLHAETQERHFYFPAKKKAYAEYTQGPLIPRVRESFMVGRNLSLEFSNNALTTPRGPEIFNVYATAQTASTSTSTRRRKRLFHNALTAGSSSSSKTDSVLWSIGPTSDDGRHSTREELPMESQSEVSRVSPLYGELRNDAAEEQIKKGITMEDRFTVYVTEPTTGRYSGYTSSATVPSPKVRDIMPTDNIIRTIEGNTGESQSSNTDLPIIETGMLSNNGGALSREITPVPVSNKSSVEQVFGKEFREEKSPMSDNGGSANLQRSHTEKPRENVRIDLRNGDIESLNHTDRDNSTRITATLNQWPVKHSAVVEGDLLLGGLMMVHEREDSITCGPVMPQGGVQALEAMLYTLDWLNKRDLVPGVKIGAHILDDCDKDTYGLEMAVDFIKGSISNIDGAEYHCNKTAVRKVISGVVGAASSVTSIQVANLLRLFRIPQVSFFSTSPELSNKMRFEYFTRTIPSDHYQVKAMVDIVLGMGWSYVSIIYEESNYGEKAYEELEKLLGKHQICIAVKEKLSKDSGVAEAHVYDNIVLKLLTKPRARGCIIFASDQEVAGVMKAVRRCNATGAFSWIGSDGWSARSLVSDGNEPEMEGTLSVQPQANAVEGFEDYFLNLTVENNRRNPWFVEFWEDHFKCRYPNASQTPYNNYTDECTTTERLTKQNTAFEDQLQFVSDAVLAFAYAFREMHKDLCRGNRGLCESMKPTKGTELLNYLRKVEFMGLSGDVFHFDKNGDGPARYNIIHFKQVSPGKYKWIRVGEYLEGELRLNMSEIQFRLGHPEPPESVCSLPCEVGQAKKYVEGESCCWHCFNCTQYQIRHHTDEKQCSLCPQGTVPDETHSYCRDIPEEFLRPESGWAIGAMSFSSTGILITLFVGGVFLKHNDTPIVRASGRELSYVLLTGILLCYLVTFALVLRPNDFVCSIQRFSAGFCFTVVYAALLTKTNRISRIFNAGKRSAKRPSFISPRSQLIICSMLIAVQILINGVWMVIDPAKAMHHYPTREDNLLVCNSYIDASYMIAFTYPIILIVVCTVYAVLTRKIPEAFNESKHIGFTMYTTCVIWLAFVPLYFATGSHVALRITSMSVTISLSASVTIACLFTPKLYIILIHPERNVRPNMMQNRYNTTKGSVATATNASSMLAPVTLTAVTCDQNKAVKKHVITTIDCSTQIEQYEMELKDQKNGKFTPAVVNRETQTLLNNNGKESSAVTSPTIKDSRTDENIISSRGLNVGKIANGPMNQNEVPL